MVALLIVVGMVLLLKGSKDDDKAFAKCKNVQDYREYVSDFGNDAKHYKEAKQLIDKYVSDSTIMAKANAEREAKKVENELFRNCNSIEDCNRYLDTYPEGRYVQEVIKKKTDLEELVTDEPEEKSNEPDANDE